MTKKLPFDDTFRVIKKRNAFAVFAAGDAFALIPGEDHVASGYGFYHDDTRLIRQMTFILRDGTGAAQATTSTRGHAPDGEHWWRHKSANGWEIEHRAFIQNDTFHHRFQWLTPPSEPINLSVDMMPGFEDVFEVRRFIDTWERHLRIEQSRQGVTLSHDGQDGQTRVLGVEASLKAVWHNVSEGRVIFDLPLPVGEDLFLTFSGARYTPGERKDNIVESFDEAAASLDMDFENFCTRFEVPGGLGDVMNDWQYQATIDLFQLQGAADGWPCTQAGIPWFAALFGRDSLIAAEQTLALAPQFAQATLKALGAFHARTNDPAFDAQVGKIPHEVRFGERARLGHVPFGRYYGSVDSTPLYISLMGRYIERTHDDVLLQDMEAVVRGAVQWLEDELNKGAFLTYHENHKDEGPYGLTEKGWKDGAPVIRADGQQAKHPIALCEVQGYAYHALLSAADLLKKLGDDEKVINRLRHRAEMLKVDFNRSFWCDDIGTYALAVDGDGEVCRIETSNPGHLLRTGIVDDPDRIQGIAKSFSDAAKLFSGWGVRTLSADSSSFIPESYQLGGVWPHDTCEALRGLLHVGEVDAAKQIFKGLQDMAQACGYRLPELVTGHPRQGPQPEVYANSCSPQAWSASIPFALIPHLKILS